MDKGPWSAGSGARGVYVQSDDFEHDVRLYINGDFADAHEKLDYAVWLAERLNSRAPDTALR
jgi:hypothetical protein